MIRLIPAISLLLSVPQAVVAAYAMTEPARSYCFLVEPSDILRVHEQALELRLYEKETRLTHTPGFYAHRIYSDAICVGQPEKVFQDRIALVQASLSGDTPILIEVDSRLNVLYMKPFDAEVEYARYFVTNEYYDNIPTLKKLTVSNSKQFAARLTQMMEEQKSTFRQDKYVADELLQKEGLIEYFKRQTQQLSATNSILRRSLWGLGLVAAITGVAVAYATRRAFFAR